MKENISEKVKKHIEPIVDKLGYEIIEVEYAKKPSGMNLTVFIDKAGGVSLDDCVTVHEAIDEPLDELDPTNGEHYILNVSSPGLDRPIKTDADLKRNVGEIVEANLYTKIGAKKQVIGELNAFDSTSITIKEVSGNELIIARDNISKLTKYIEI